MCIGLVLTILWIIHIIDMLLNRIININLYVYTTKADEKDCVAIAPPK